MNLTCNAIHSVAFRETAIGRSSRLIGLCVSQPLPSCIDGVCRIARSGNRWCRSAFVHSIRNHGRSSLGCDGTYGSLGLLMTCAAIIVLQPLDRTPYPPYFGSIETRSQFSRKTLGNPLCASFPRSVLLDTDRGPDVPRLAEHRMQKRGATPRTRLGVKGTLVVAIRGQPVSPARTPPLVQ